MQLYFYYLSSDTTASADGSLFKKNLLARTAKMHGNTIFTLFKQRGKK